MFRYLFRIKSVLAGLLLITLVMPGCTSGPPPYTPYTPVDNVLRPTTVASMPQPFLTPRTVYHEVGPAETLWRIAKTYDVDMQTIMDHNNLTDANALKNGQTLIIPNTRGPKPVIPLYPTDKWKYIVIHHTATYEGNARSIDAMHHDRGFWNGLGYHFLINNGTDGKYDGQIEVGPRWIKQKDGAHANTGGMNQMGIGVSLVGNYSETRVSDKSLEALVYLVKTLQDYYNIPSTRVIKHSEVPGKNTECPGLLFPWIEFKNRLARS